MAVPKRKMSRSNTRHRRAQWKAVAPESGADHRQRQAEAGAARADAPLPQPRGPELTGHRHAYTAIACRGPDCERPHNETILAGLRECVRRNGYGVLVTAGCLLGRLGCHALGVSGRRAGTLVVVQRCAPDRRPIGPALWIGPLSTAEDLASVCRWLDTGDLTSTTLPAPLRFRATLAGRDRAN